AFLHPAPDEVVVGRGVSAAFGSGHLSLPVQTKLTVLNGVLASVENEPGILQNARPTVIAGVAGEFALHTLTLWRTLTLRRRRAILRLHPTLTLRLHPVHDVEVVRRHVED